MNQNEQFVMFFAKELISRDWTDKQVWGLSHLANNSEPEDDQ